MNEKVEIFKNKNVVFYDGECGLCHKSVQILLKMDRTRQLYFCPLQSELAKEFLKNYSLSYPYLSTLIFWDQSQVYEKSKAFLKALQSIPVYKFLGYLGLIIPWFVRDFIYDLIAQNRLYFFDKPTCEIPEKGDVSRWIS